MKYYHEIEGVNSRLDEMQAALLTVKLKHLDELTGERVEVAKQYQNQIKNILVRLPKVRENATHVFHLFVVRVKERRRFQEFLREKGIDTQIHYPIPPHRSECYRHYKWSNIDLPITEEYSDEIVSLPLYNGMSEEELDYVIKCVNGFC